MTASNPLVKPPPLRPGDTIAVISPASPTVEPPEAFDNGITLLEEAGFRVKLMPHARHKHLYLGGTDAQRLADLHAAFTDPEVRAILSARGGYGCMRLLPHLDFSLIQAHPKLLIGFSDLTSLLLPLYGRCGLVGLYGPMLTSNLIHDEPFSQQGLFDLACQRISFPAVVPNTDRYYQFQPGTAEAPLIGGNLSLLAALCGTPYQPDTRGHLLFIEDWKEKYYSLDRQFQQLHLAGLLDGIAGLILCDFSDITPEPELALPDFLRTLMQDLQIRVPCGYGFSVGHGPQTATLPIGTSARWEAESGTLTLLESPVS